MHPKRLKVSIFASQPYQTDPAPFDPWMMPDQKAQMNRHSFRKSAQIALAATLLGFTFSTANDIAFSNNIPLEPTSKEVRILGQLLSQVGNGNLGDGYDGVSREVNSDFGMGLRIGAGMSWKHFAATLNAEYLLRHLEISETTIAAFPLPSNKETLKYQYLKLQPEATIKTNLGNALEIGAISGIGMRTKLNSDPGENGLDKSLSLGCYGQFRGINIRLSEELFYQNLHNSEKSNTAISIGYSHSIPLK